MMNKHLRLFATLLLLNTGSTVFADTATDMTVSGLVTPSSCTATLSGNGVIDHGKIAAHGLNPGTPTALPTQWLDLEIHCTAPMLFALVGIDDRADSSPAPGTAFGLGKNTHAPDEHLGSVSLAFENALADTQPMQSMASTNQGATWTAQEAIHPRALMAFSRPGRPLPEHIVELNTRIRANTVINPAHRLTLKHEVPLDGSLVLDLRYL